MQKVREYKLRKTSDRGSSITIPNVFITDTGIKNGDIIDVYRDNVLGREALILIPQRKKRNDR